MADDKMKRKSDQESQTGSHGVPEKNGRRQFIVCSVVTVVLILAIIVLAILVGLHSKKIESIDSDHESVLERIEQLEKNTIDTLSLLSKLQSTLTDTIEKSTQLEKQLNDTQLELSTKGKELESSLEMIAELQRELNSTKSKTSTLEASHEQLSTDLRHTADELNTTKARVNDLEGMLETTAARVVTLEVELNSTKSVVALLNATKASKLAVTEVSHMLAQLNEDKATRTELHTITQTLEENTTRVELTLQSQTSELEQKLTQELNSNKNKTSRLENNHLELTMDLEELNSTITGFKDTIKDLEEELANTTGRAEMTEVRVDWVESGIASLNTTKARIEAVNELSDKVAQLDTEQADRTEVEILSANLTSLQATNTTHERVSELESELIDVREDLNLTAEMVDNARADIAELEQQFNTTTSILQIGHQELSASLGLTRQELNSTASALQGTVQDLEDWLTNITERTVTLETRGNRIESDIVSLNSTKASRDTVNDQVKKLEREKVNLTEFELLSDNVSALAKVSSRADEEIRQELDELADSALNQTHYHELHQAIASKASQTDLEALASSTVRTQTFLQRVESIQNSILQLQWNITMNFTHFDGRIQTLNMTLSTKADQQDVTTLSNRVSTFEASTVDKDTFQVLRDTVEDIDERKADKADLNLLQGRVNSLERNTATKSELRSLDDKLSGYSSTSDGVHNRLSSDIRSNSDSISSNTGKITTLESSTSGLTPSQLVIALTVSLTLVTIPWAA